MAKRNAVLKVVPEVEVYKFANHHAKNVGASGAVASTGSDNKGSRANTQKTQKETLTGEINKSHWARTIDGQIVAVTETETFASSKASQKRTCPECGAECKGRFCSVCVGKMLGTWDGNTVNLPTTNAPVQVPSTVIEKDESKPDYSEIFVKPNAGNKKCHLATDPEGTGFADEILCDGEGSPLNDFRTQDDAVRYARKHYPGAKVIVLSCI